MSNNRTIQDKDNKTQSLELEVTRIQIIKYLKQCIIICKTPEQTFKALEKMNEFLEKLPRKKD